MRILILLIFITACSSSKQLIYKKGILKKTKEKAFLVIKEEKTYYLVKQKEHYKEGKKIYVTPEQFSSFEIHEDKEKYLEELIHSGRVNYIRNFFNTVEINFDELDSTKE